MDIRKNIEEAAKEMDRKTIARLLGHIEKYSVEVSDVEELLWNLLDEIDKEQENNQTK